MFYQSCSFLLEVKKILGIVLFVGLIAGIDLFTIQNCNANEPETQALLHSHDNQVKACYLCDPSMRDKGRLWCKEHNRYENRCWVCQPQLEDKNRAYCEEHGLYEDECFICNPTLNRKKIDDSSKTLQTNLALFCKEHRVPEHECGICHPQRASDLKPGQSMKVRLVSKLSANKAGVRTSLPQATQSSPAVEVYCQVGYNKNVLVHITPLAAGVIKRVLFDVGTQIKSGDILVEIHSAKIAEAKSQFLAATVDRRLKKIVVNREEKLVKRKISATYEYQNARADYKDALLTNNTARQKLLNYGFTDKEIAEIETEQDSSSLLQIRAPYSGKLVSREAVVGEFVTPGKTLFTLADLKNMWLELSVPADYAVELEHGQDIAATFKSLPGIISKGKITWVATEIDERTRMLKARAVVPNEEGRLKAGMFGNVRVTTSKTAKVFLVPTDAVQLYKHNSYLFIKIEDDLYALRRIVVGNKTDHKIEVIEGVKENDDVVVAGAFTLMSEFLKSRLGAGCVDD